MQYSPIKLALFHFSNYRELSFKRQITFPFNEIKNEDEFLRDIPLDKVNTEMKVEYRWKFTKSKSRLHPKNLAEAGFFYSPNSEDEHKDVVTCYMCQCQIDNWATGDNPIQYHCEAAPNCHLVVSKLKFLNESLDLEKVPFTDEKHFTSRLKTFRQWWPRQFKKSKCCPYELAQAGFCLNATTEYPDQVECIHCKLIVKEWKRTQVPFQVHCRSSPDCPIVKLVLEQSSKKSKVKRLYLPTGARALKKLSKAGVKQEEPNVIYIEKSHCSPIATSKAKKRGRKPNAINKSSKSQFTAIDNDTPYKPYSLRSSKKPKLKQEESSTNALFEIHKHIDIRENKFAKPQTLKVSNLQKPDNAPVVKYEQKSIIIQHFPKNINNNTYADNQNKTNLVSTVNAPKIDSIHSKSLRSVSHLSPTVTPLHLTDPSTQSSQPNPIESTKQPIDTNPKASLSHPSKINSISSSSTNKKSSSKNTPATTISTYSKHQAHLYLKPHSRQTPAKQDRPIKSSPSEVSEFWNHLPPQANITTVIPKGTRLKLGVEDKETFYHLAKFTKQFTLPQMRPTKTLDEFSGTPKQYLELTKQKARDIATKRTQHDTIRKQKTIEILRNWESDNRLKAELKRMRAHVERKKRLKEEQRKKEQAN